jgi:hypothetical protein
MREITNPNTLDEPRDLTPAEVAALAKTGCGHCNGDGALRIVRTMASEVPGTRPAPVVTRNLCRCVAKRVRESKAVIQHRGNIAWAPRAKEHVE